MSTPEARITISANGSLKVEGDIPLYDDQGNRLETREGKPYFLCRCGASEKKPFCDGRHKIADWDPSLLG